MNLKSLFTKTKNPVIAVQTCLGKHWLVNLNDVTERIPFDYELTFSNEIYCGSIKTNGITNAYHLYRSGEDFICVFWNKIYKISNMISLTWIPSPNEKSDSEQILIGLSKNNTIEIEFFKHHVEEDRTFDVTYEFVSHNKVGSLSSEYLMYIQNNITEDDSASFGIQYNLLIDLKWRNIAKCFSIKEITPDGSKTNYYYSKHYYYSSYHDKKNNTIYYFRFSTEKLESYIMKDVFYWDPLFSMNDDGIFTTNNFKFHSLKNLYEALPGNYHDYSYYLFACNDKNPLVFVTNENALKNANVPDFMENFLSVENFVSGILFSTETNSIIHSASIKKEIPFDKQTSNFLMCDFSVAPYIFSVGTEEKPLYEIHVKKIDCVFYADEMPIVIHCKNQYDVIFINVKVELNPSHPYFAIPYNVETGVKEFKHMLVLNNNHEVTSFSFNTSFHELIPGNFADKNLNSQFGELYNLLSNNVFYAKSCDTLIVRSETNKNGNPYHLIHDICNICHDFDTFNFMNRCYSSYQPFYTIPSYEYETPDKKKEKNMLKEIELTSIDSNLDEKKYVLNNRGKVMDIDEYLEDEFENAKKVYPEYTLYED